MIIARVPGMGHVLLPPEEIGFPGEMIERGIQALAGLLAERLATWWPASPSRWSSSAARAHAVVVSVLTPAETMIRQTRRRSRTWRRASRLTLCLEVPGNASGIVRDVGKYMPVTRCRSGLTGMVATRGGYRRWRRSVLAIFPIGAH